MKKLVIVKPKRTDAPDGSVSHYEYPSASGMQTQIITYNRTLGDFLKEQLWLVSGTQEQIDNFVANSEVSLVETWDAADVLTKTWNPDRKVMNDSEAVVKEVEVIVATLKAESKSVSAALDPDDSTPGIVMRKFNLSDHVKSAELS